MPPSRRPSPANSWALYDFGNSAFATTVMAGFFPVFFKEYWAAGMDPTASTLRLGIVNSAAGILVAVLAPLLGAAADRAGSRKRLLLGFAGLGILSTALLPLVDRGAWEAAALLFGLGVLGFAFGNVFYDSLLPDVAAKGEEDRVSARGYAFGYLGGGLLLSLNLSFVLKPSWFGLPDAPAAVRLSILSAALWWLIFSLPLVRNVKEKNLERGACPRRRDGKEPWRPSGASGSCPTPSSSWWPTGATWTAWTP